MGWGDEIMAAGRAREVAARSGKRVAILDRRGVARWNEIWDGNPIIAHPDEFARDPTRYAAITDGPGCRPYHDHSKGRLGHWGYADDFQARDYPGEMFLSTAERLWAIETLGFVLGDCRSFITIEPHTNPKNSPGKDWGFGNWQAVVDANPDIVFVQLVHDGLDELEGVEAIDCPTFRQACAVLAWADAHIGPEGALVHAAAAFGVPSVAFFGGFTHPDIVGYEGNINLYADIPGSPCGAHGACDHCERAKDMITPEMVSDGLKAVLAANMQGD